METDWESKDIEQLLADADELIQKITSDAIKDMQEEHRLRFEKSTRSLEMLKFEVQGKLEKNKAKKSSGAEGMHEAIQEIAKAMGDLKKYLS
ncbi:MAG: hypothetical protein C4519_13385 [Desulfobacteraceae bacterium]|nr:MAG: hypothetical protein C4519_13385 [Desulfobacteraceae bacterium]